MILKHKSLLINFKSINLLKYLNLQNLWLLGLIIFSYPNLSEKDINK